MRRIVWVAGIGLAVSGVAALRTPTAALVQLKLALDRHDLAAVQRRVDERALASEALAGLVEETPGGAEPIRLAVRGDAGWLPAIPSARSWLRLRLERAVERLVEDPAHRFTVSWEQLDDTLATLERSGATAFFRFADAAGASYTVRMRQGWWHWRIVSVQRDGASVLLAPPPPGEAPEAPAPASFAGEAIAGIVTDPPPDVDLDEEIGDYTDDDARDEVTEPVAAAPPALRLAPMIATASSGGAGAHWMPGGRPFVRRLDAASWTVQVGSSTDALAAAVQRDRFTTRGEDAFVHPVRVRGTQWHRVLIGRFETKRDADQVAARLAAGSRD